MSDLPTFLINKEIFTGVSLAANATSEVVDIAEVPGYCVHAVWSGTPVGNLSIQGSNDGLNFVSVSTLATGGTNGQLLLNVERVHYRYVQVTYTSTSGDGNMSCWISGKRD